MVAGVDTQSSFYVKDLSIQNWNTRNANVGVRLMLRKVGNGLRKHSLLQLATAQVVAFLERVPTSVGPNWFWTTGSWDYITSQIF